MNSDDQNAENGQQDPPQGPEDEDVSSNSDNPTPTVDSDHESTKDEGDLGNQDRTQHLTEPPVTNMHHQSNTDGQPPTTPASIKREKTCNCHTLLDTVTKEVAVQKLEKDRAKDTPETNESEKPQKAPPKNQDGRSLAQARFAFVSLPFCILEKASDSNHSSTWLFGHHGAFPESSDDLSPRATSIDSVSSWAGTVVSEVRPEDIDDNSPSRLEWLRQKRERNEENPYLDQLMSLVGLETVKAHFLTVKARVEESQNIDPGMANLRLHMVLQGKDGTGKKTIAKLYAQFLVSIGAVSGQGLSKIQSAQGMSSNMRSTIVFYDEPSQGEEDWPSGMYDDLYDDDDNHLRSYSPRPIRSRNSDPMKELMKTATMPIFILCSRNKSLLESIERNEKALEKFQSPFILPDYDEEELKQLVVRMIQKRGMMTEGGSGDLSLRALVRRVARDRKSKSFSNVHRLEQELDEACIRRALRLQAEYTKWFKKGPIRTPQADLFSGRISQNESKTDDDLKAADPSHGQKRLLTSEDLLGPEPEDVRNKNESWKKLQEMIGLEKVKSQCDNVIDYAQHNRSLELQGMAPLKIGLNRVFLGPPGVGKTTVAQLYGQILIDLGLVSGKKFMLQTLPT